jgi:hypothetical protein
MKTMRLRDRKRVIGIGTAPLGKVESRDRMSALLGLSAARRVFSGSTDAALERKKNI